jgi:hypothetical protein
MPQPNTALYSIQTPALITADGNQSGFAFGHVARMSLQPPSKSFKVLLTEKTPSTGQIFKKFPK